LPGNDGAPVNDLILEQYDVVYGSWPNSYDEIVLVVDENNELDDITLYALGLLPEKDIDDLSNAAVNGTPLTDKGTVKWSFEDICNTEYKTILSADCYRYDEATDCYIDLRKTEAGLRYLYDNAMTLKVTGIVKPAEDSGTNMLTGTIAYTDRLTKYLVEKAAGADVITAQLADPNHDVLTGLPFDATTGVLPDEEKERVLREHLQSLDAQGKADAYIAINSIPDEAFLEQQVSAILSSMTREDMEITLSQGMGEQMGISMEEILQYLASMTDEELNEVFAELIEKQIRSQYAAEVAGQMSAMGVDALAGALDMSLAAYTTEQCARYYDEIMEFSASTYEDNLALMGYVDLEFPSTINIYASSFENKDVIVEAIDDYNQSVEELKQIKYTDILGIMMSSITTIINAITYVLIAFVAISLIVSSIMIGVITLISVQERTKEIGILRAIGASKKNVSSMFNAETMIIGFASGLLGVVVTYLLCIPINMILHHVTGIVILNAILPVSAAVILVLISITLTLFAGLIPSRSAAKKDPVVALRTE